MRTSMSFFIQNMSVSMFLKKKKKKTFFPGNVLLELLILWEKQIKGKQINNKENKTTLKAISCRMDQKLTGEI